ncbi:hypothetical protein SNE40_011732 [Patella caerulea]|uniref:Uncharacterized protein n=1 Tax=Patella caerulea TaxID=87958 RepID=A0AAN8JNY8_PATCE
MATSGGDVIANEIDSSDDEEVPWNTERTIQQNQKDITAEDLSNPDTLLEKLETVDLTEEDTEELLHEAYKVNMKLKEILRRQEQNDGIQMRRVHTAGGLSGKNGGAQKFSSQKSPLPPISTNVDGLTRNAYTSQAGTRTASQRNSNRVTSSQGKRSPSRRKTSAKETKPDWDSRFSYS